MNKIAKDITNLFIRVHLRPLVRRSLLGLRSLGEVGGEVGSAVRITPPTIPKI